jgi:quinoprotein relay system zinc metallohydrolase 2
VLTRRRALRLAASLPLALARPAHAAVPLWPMSEVAPGVFVRRGVDEDASADNQNAIANTGFIVGDRAVAVIDPGGSRADGERLAASVHEATDKPARFVILTHVHPDHVFGCAAFADAGATVVGHARLPAALAERGAYYRNRLAALLGEEGAGDYLVPRQLIADRGVLDLGNRVLSLQAHPAAHSDTDLSIFDETTATLWAGDLLFVGRVPSLDGSLTGWLRELAALRALPASRAVPGHGPPFVPWPDGAGDEERYLRTLVREIRAMIAKGEDIDAAVETVGLSERDRWRLFDDYNGHNVTVAFKELEWE